MSVRHAVIMTLSGPAEAVDEVLAALDKAGLAAYPDKSPWPDNPEEAALGWASVEAHEGGDGPPSAEFQRQCEQRATAAAGPFGYTVRTGPGVVIGGSADTREVVDRRTGEVLIRTNDDSLESLAPTLLQLGIDPSGVELREPPNLWRIPEG